MHAKKCHSLYIVSLGLGEKFRQGEGQGEGGGGNKLEGTWQVRRSNAMNNMGGTYMACAGSRWG